MLFVETCERFFRFFTCLSFGTAQKYASKVLPKHKQKEVIAFGGGLFSFRWSEGIQTHSIKLPVAAWMPPAGRGHHHNALDSPRLHRPGQQETDRVEPRRGDLNLFNQSAGGALVHFGWTKCTPQCPRFPSAPPPRITGSR